MKTIDDVIATLMPYVDTRTAPHSLINAEASLILAEELRKTQAAVIALVELMERHVKAHP